MPGWRTTTTTWRKLNCTQHRQTAQASASQRERTNGLPSYLTPNCRLQIRPHNCSFSAPREKINVAAVAVKNRCDANICASAWSHFAFSLQPVCAAFAAAFSEVFTTWGRTEGPRGQIATHHLFLGHQAATGPLHTWWPPGPALQQRLLHFCKIVRKSCGRLDLGNYGAAADENSFPSPGVMHSCTGVRSLLSNLHSLAKWRLLTYFATDWPPSCWSCWWCWWPHFERLHPPFSLQHDQRRSSSTNSSFFFFRPQRCGKHVKSRQRVSRNCCLLRPFASGPPSSARPSAFDPHRAAASPRAQLQELTAARSDQQGVNSDFT